MKIIAAADIHQMDRTPAGRVDSDFIATELNKLRWIVRQCVKHKAILCIAGDVFDKAITSVSLTAAVACVLQRVPGNHVYFVPGQHDLPYHVERHYKNSSLALLEHLGVAKRIASNNPIIVDDEVAVHGAGWGEPFPELSHDFDHLRNIVVTHRMVIKDKLLWPGQTGFSRAKRLIKKYPAFDIIVSGDNHQTFKSEYDGRILLNPGSMMRLTRAQDTHVPQVFLVESDDLSVESLKIPIKHDNLDVSSAPAANEVSEELQQYVKQLTEARTGHAQIDFMDHVRAVLESPKIKPKTKQALKNIMENCDA